MGTDTPLACSPTTAAAVNYFRQLFAQGRTLPSTPYGKQVVMSPPVTSERAHILEETPQHCHR